MDITDLRGVKEFIKDTMKYIFIIIAVLLVYLYVVSFQQVLGPSMQPNYREGEIYLLNKLKYKIINPKRFEVIVLNNKKSKFMIKRVIGLPGEHIEYREDTLYVDGKIVKEQFSKTLEPDETLILEKNVDLVIPDNCYYVLGDNRVNSEDSRMFGCVEKKDIIGKVEFRIWPLFKG
ncbi:MAG: signal peptidase I [Bacilli bacterium]|nr:signal peptidase I [Bacilli bacterium]